VPPRREGDALRWSEGWNRWDANASYRTRLFKCPATLNLVVRNVTDRVYRDDRDTFAQPRQFVGSISTEF